MPNNPRVSIGLPVYNGEEYLAEAIESALAQTYRDLELIISDNGSTDGTQAICERYAARDSRVRYVRSPNNRGAVWNFNRVVELAGGEFFKWHAADDRIAPEFVEQAVGVLDSDPGVVLVMSRAAVIDAEGQLIEELPGQAAPVALRLTDGADSTRWDFLTSARADRRYRGVLLYSVRCYEEFGLIRKDVMRRTGGHRPYRGAEKVLLAELSLLGRFAEIPQVLFFNRWHNARFSALGSAKAQLQWVHPAAKSKFILPRQVRCTVGYTAAIFGIPMRLHERLGCAAVLARFVLRVGKWKSLLGETIRGDGMLARLPASQSAKKNSTVSVPQPLATSAATRD